MCKEKVTGPAKDNCERLGAKRCLQCGAFMYPTQSGPYSVFCSPHCKALAEYGE